MAAEIFADCTENEVKVATEFRHEKHLPLNLRVYFFTHIQY